MKLSDQLRQQLEACGRTLYAISKETGIDQASLGKFRNGERGLSWQAVDKLGELLGLQIVTNKKESTVVKRKAVKRG